MMIKRLKTLFKNTYYKNKACGVVLIYHRVAVLENDTHQLAVSPKKFEEQIKYLKNRFNVISLQEMISELKNGRMQKNSIVITFDDGYADNLYNAKPILEKYSIPATIFVTAGMVGSNREFWWDELDKIILSNRIKGCRDMNKYMELHSLLKNMDYEQRDQAIKTMAMESGISLKARKSHRILNHKELKELSKSSVIEIGAHTMYHSVLANSILEKYEYEIKESKRVLEEILGYEIKSFSYPFGGIEDVSDEAKHLVKESGFECGIANEQGIVYKTTDPFWVPRRIVRNWDINEFRQNIDSFLFASVTDLFVASRKVFISSFAAHRTYNNKLLPAIKKHNIQKESKKHVKNILHINTHDNIGGAGKLAYQLNNLLNSKMYNSNMLVDRSITDHPKVSVLPRDNSKQQRMLEYYQQRYGWLDFFCMQSMHIKDLQIFKEIDILNLHNLHGGYFSLFALPELTAYKPTVWTLHDMQAITGHCAHSFDCEKWTSGCKNCSNLKTYPSIDVDTAEFLWKTKGKIYENSYLNIVCPSLWLARKVQNSILKDKNVTVIHNGVDSKTFKLIDKNYAKRILDFKENTKLIMFSAHGGAENIWKGGKYINLVYNSLCDKEDILFLNIGGEKTCYRHKNWLDVSYIYDEKMLALYYSAADLFIYPSVADNCPLVVIESLMCGTPVVCFNTGGIPELVQHLKTGYVAKYENVEDFIKGINLFLKDNELRKYAGIEAAEDASKRYTLDVMTNKYIKLYEQVIRDHGK